MFRVIMSEVAARGHRHTRLLQDSSGETKAVGGEAPAIGIHIKCTAGANRHRESQVAQRGEQVIAALRKLAAAVLEYVYSLILKGGQGGILRRRRCGQE
jgi:hypothetical protein